MNTLQPSPLYWALPSALFLSDAALAYAIDPANGDVDDGKEIIDVEFEEIDSDPVRNE